jgi:hypothetical protein
MLNFSYINPLKNCDYYKYNLILNTRMFRYTEYIFVLCVILRIKRCYFSTQHQPVDLRNGDEVCFLCCRNWIFQHYLDELQASLLINDATSIVYGI